MASVDYGIIVRSEGDRVWVKPRCPHCNYLEQSDWNHIIFYVPTMQHSRKTNGYTCTVVSCLCESFVCYCVGEYSTSCNRPVLAVKGHNDTCFFALVNNSFANNNICHNVCLPTSEYRLNFFVIACICARRNL